MDVRTGQAEVDGLQIVLQIRAGHHGADRDRFRVGGAADQGDVHVEGGLVRKFGYRIYVGHNAEIRRLVGTESKLGGIGAANLDGGHVGQAVEDQFTSKRQRGLDLAVQRRQRDGVIDVLNEIGFDCIVAPRRFGDGDIR